MNEIEKQHQELNGKLRLEIKELETIIHSQAEEIKLLYEGQENITFKKRIKELENGFKSTTDELCEYAEENKKLKQDIKFCLVRIRQERKMSTDERTRKEMKTCEEILSKYE